MILPLMLSGTIAVAHPDPEPTPVCETVLVQENSGNGPNYKIELCGTKALPIHTIIVDGAAFPERSFASRVITFWNP